jgi:hypothetical protein
MERASMIIEMVALFFRLSVEELERQKGSRKDAKTVRAGLAGSDRVREKFQRTYARWVVIHLISEFTSLQDKQIGALLNLRGRSVVYGRSALLNEMFLKGKCRNEVQYLDGNVRAVLTGHQRELLAGKAESRKQKVEA